MIPKSTPAYSGVIVRNDKHPRNGQAGAFLVVNEAAPDTRCDVKFDSDGVIEATAFADLDRL